MIKYAVVFLFSATVLQAQDSTQQISTDLEIGAVFEIGEPEKNTYKHINFPRANFIIKRGGLANYKSVAGKKVVITSVKQKKDGATEIKIKRNDGGRFFGSHNVVTADFEEAIKSGELQAK